MGFEDGGRGHMMEMVEVEEGEKSLNGYGHGHL
jgi:hypothetical protein